MAFLSVSCLNACSCGRRLRRYLMRPTTARQRWSAGAIASCSSSVTADCASLKHSSYVVLRRSLKGLSTSMLGVVGRASLDMRP